MVVRGVVGDREASSPPSPPAFVDHPRASAPAPSYLFAVVKPDQCPSREFDWPMLSCVVNVPVHLLTHSPTLIHTHTQGGLVPVGGRREEVSKVAGLGWERRLSLLLCLISPFVYLFISSCRLRL